jgi:hypothetical protein
MVETGVMVETGETGEMDYRDRKVPKATTD